MTIRFDDRVAIVTGAGQGLGRSHALALASRGARVVVNDLGGARDGSSSSTGPAERVAEEIRAAGGEAMANGANVAKMAEVTQMVEAVMAKWGRVDILVNNAGILRDKSFQKMKIEDFGIVVDVHLMGAANCTKAVWSIMREQQYGRIVMTTSSSGLYGNFGQANYGAAKMAVVGLMNTLCLEGAKYGIRVNALSPCAATRMTEGLMPEQALDMLRTGSVTTGLLYLVNENGPNHEILCAGAGVFASTRIYETDGLYLRPEELSPENLAANWDKVTDAGLQKEYQHGGEQTVKFLTKASSALGIKL